MLKGTTCSRAVASGHITSYLLFLELLLPFNGPAAFESVSHVRNRPTSQQLRCFTMCTDAAVIKAGYFLVTGCFDLDKD